MNSGPPGPMPGQKDDRIRKGELFDEQRKKEEEDGGVDFEAIFARIAKLEEMSARNSTDRMKLEKRTNYLGKVVEDLHMEAKEEENCVRMTSRTANFGSTDIRFKKKNISTCSPSIGCWCAWWSRGDDSCYKAGCGQSRT